MEKDDIRRGLSFTPLHVVGLVCFLGNYSGPWGSYLREIQTSISHNMQGRTETHQSGGAAAAVTGTRQELHDVMLKFPVLL